MFYQRKNSEIHRARIPYKLTNFKTSNSYFSSFIHVPSKSEEPMHILEARDVCTAPSVVELNIYSKIQTEHHIKMATPGQTTYLAQYLTNSK